MPVLRHDPEILLKAQGMHLVFFDVDGVLTDGSLYFSSDGESLKRFSVLDGHGLKLLKAAGMVVAVISGRDSNALRLRLRELEITHVQCGVQDKSAAASTMLQALGLRWEQAAAMGDDWPDLRLMQACAFRAAPPNAHAEVLAVADYVTTRRGGEGAVREFCDLLLMARGKYAGLLEEAAS